MAEFKPMESPVTASPEALELGYMRDRYGLTVKQAKYALQVIKEPQMSDSERARRAGYSDGARTMDGGANLKAPKIGIATTTERALIEERAKSFSKAIDADARVAIQNKLTEHAENENITPNQTRAVELLGKMKGVFIERIELDAGEHTRARYADQMLNNLANDSGETEA